jgi:hypothetical protein
MLERNVLQTCQFCQERFASRNKLFKHLQSCKRREPPKQFDEIDLSMVTIYVTGGRVRGRTLASVEKYSFATNSWELGPYLKENRGSHGAAAVGNCIYVFGGGGFDSNLATCEAYDTKRSEWQFIASMSIYRHALALVTYEMKSSVSTLHLTNVSDLEQPPSSSSSSSSKLPSKWYIFAIGGWIDGKICSADVEKYDIVNNTWSLCSKMSVARRLLGATTYNGLIYVFGGNCDDGVWYSAAVEVYTPSLDVWNRLKDMPIPGPASAITVHDFIYIFIHGSYVYQYNPLTETYRKRSELPLPEFYTFDVTAYGPFIFLHGGASQGVWSKALFQYDTRNDHWTRLPDMLRQRRRCAAALLSNNYEIN